MQINKHVPESFIEQWTCHNISFLVNKPGL